MLVEFLSTFLTISAILIISTAWKFINRKWFTPKKIEKFLKDQGIHGTSYNFFNGNASTTPTAPAEYKPAMEISHQIVPRLMPLVLQSVKKYGKVSLSWVGALPVVTIVDTDMIREVLTNTSGHFDIDQDPHSDLKWLNAGLPYQVGEKWAKLRRIVSPIFRMEKIRLMLPVFDRCCREMVEKWQNLVLEGSAELDVALELTNLTEDVIMRTAFGNNFKEGQRVHQLLTEQIRLVMEVTPAIHIPCSRYFPTKRMKRIKKIFGDMGHLIGNVIKKKEEAIKSGEIYNDDLLGALMESNLKEINNNENFKAVGLTIEELIEECKTFYFGGHDTTASLLIWTMILLSMHPEWQTKAREEVMHVFGRNTPHFDGLNQLKIVMMILNEVLRLYPPAMLLRRMVLKEVKVGKYILPAGVQISIPTLLVHHDHELWGHDVDEFKPERFSEGVARATNNQFSFFPFSSGPRICIGKSFALLEAKIGIAIILQHFSFELSYNYKHAPILGAPISFFVSEHCAKLILHKL